MSTTITLEFDSSMDNNLRDSFPHTHYYRWVRIGYIRSLPGVISATAAFGAIIIKFDSEADKTWFILRWT